MKTKLFLCSFLFLATLLSAAQNPPPEVDLSCTASTSPVAGYNFYRSAVSGGPYVKLNTSPVLTCAYNDLTVVRGSTYYYVATAQDSTGLISSNSNEVKVVLPLPPQPPTSLQITAIK